MGLIKRSKLFSETPDLMVVNCCVVNTAIVVAVADALVERQLEQELSHVQF